MALTEKEAIERAEESVARLIKQGKLAHEQAEMIEVLAKAAKDNDTSEQDEAVELAQKDLVEAEGWAKGVIEEVREFVAACERQRTAEGKVELKLDFADPPRHDDPDLKELLRVANEAWDHLQ